MGWNVVCDQVKQNESWVPAKNPMVGIRFVEMNEDGSGYLAVRWRTARYFFEEVPKRLYDVLLKHRCASVYFRKYIRDKYLCVEIKKYELPEEYERDEAPVREKLEKMAAERLEKALASKPMQGYLFFN